jgi:hypothetical protein
MPYQDFLRATYRVYGQPVDRDGGVDDLLPMTGTAMQEEPPKEPSPYTVEGLIAGFGKISSAATHGDIRARRAAQGLAFVYVVPLVVVVLAGVGVALGRAFGYL